VLDVIDGGRKNAFVDRSDPAFKFFRIESVKNPDCGDHGNIDVRKNVSGCSEDYYRTDQEDQQSQNNESVGSIERYPDNPHLLYR
jgi:hypothetical protein